MAKTTSSSQEQQEKTTMQSPPLIISDYDQKGENNNNDVGVVVIKINDDEKGVALDDYDHHDIEGSNNNMCVIDVKNNNEDEEIKEKVIRSNNDDVDDDDEKVCRICQLRSSSDDDHDRVRGGAGNVNLVLLGCACRGELGISHYHCAFLWFQQKGNRTCEICGKPAKNIVGIEDTGFRVFPTDIDIITSEIARSSGSSTTDRRCSSCVSKFLLAVVVLAFILPWAIHPKKLL